MYSEFAVDAKMQMMSEAFQRRYIMLLCLRSSNGDVTLHDDEIAFQLRIDVTEWAETKGVFISKNLIDKDNNITAWNKRQYISDSSAERVKKHREKKKQECNVTVTPPDTDTDTDTEKSKPNLKVEKKTATASRLPHDWMPSLDDALFCSQERPDLKIDSVADRFRDYWTALAGKDACKVDWHATWRNWVRKENQVAQPRASPTKPEKFDPLAYVNSNFGRGKNQHERTIEFNEFGEPV